MALRQRRITVTIDGNGKITADAEGFTGDACVADLEQLLGGLDSWLEVTRKPDGAGAGGERHRVAEQNRLGAAEADRPRRRIGGTP